MVKVLFFADSHLGFDYPIRPRIERRRRGHDFFSNYHLILETAQREAVDVIVHGGDVFFRSKIPPAIVQKAYEPLLPVLESGIKLFFVPGNHERSRLPASPLFHHKNFYLFDRPRAFELEINGLGTTWGGFPNIRDRVQQQFQGVLDQIGFGRYGDRLNILCMHQSIEGAVVGAQNYTFRSASDVVRCDQFPDYLDLALSGHIHRQQVLRSISNTPLIYSGSIERTSFAERHEAKGFFLLNLSIEEIEWEFIPLPTRPMLEWTLPQDLMNKNSLLREIKLYATGISPQAILCIRCSNVHQLEMIKISDLRQHLPETMNVDLMPPRTSNHKPWSAYSD